MLAVHQDYCSGILDHRPSAPATLAPADRNCGKIHLPLTKKRQHSEWKCVAYRITPGRQVPSAERDARMTRSYLRLFPAMAFVLAAGLISLSDARGDVVILKDGYTLYGKLVREKAIVQDDVNGRNFIADKVNGLTALNDGPRWTFFPASNKQVADVSDANKFKDLTEYKNKERPIIGDMPLPPDVYNPIVSEWNDSTWKRDIVFTDGKDKNAKHTVKQYIAVINPYFIRIGSSTYRWNMFFLTKEFSPARIRRFLNNHPDIMESPGKPEVDKRERLIRFWIQADWLEEALNDLKVFAIDMPAEKMRHQKLLSEVNELIADKLIAEVERAREAGRHQLVNKILTAFPKQDVSPKVAQRVTVLRAEYETLIGRLNAARRYLSELIAKQNATGESFLNEAAATVSMELHLDTVSRVETFITLAEQAERDLKAGRKPLQTPGELLASAITAWHFGKVAADTKVDAARKVWIARGFALEYLRTLNPKSRLELMSNYRKLSDALPYDELEKLISYLPPPVALSTISPQLQSLTTEPTNENPKGVDFWLKLPDEYTHTRAYPVLIVLPNGDAKGEEVLNALGDMPNKFGYIVAIPKIFDPINNFYRHSQGECRAVTGLVRHLRRSLQVDSDRIFLFGGGEGATMALDVAAGHPDLFAGITVMNPKPLQRIYVTGEYWVNFEQLPTYIVLGEKIGESGATVRALLERWMPKGFSTIAVSYKGRGADFFREELPFMFDWMTRKKRAEPNKTLGPPEYVGPPPGFRSLRLTDTRFHWLSLDEINSSNLLSSDFGMTPYTFKLPSPAKISAKMEEGNVVRFRQVGVKAVTVWLGKGMFDYSKPIKLISDGKKPLIQTVSPSIDVLMEDLFERGDRQRPYFGKIEYRL
jgi:hypothetical protein